MNIDSSRSFNAALLQVCREKNSYLCAGFDPDSARFTPEFCAWSGLNSQDDARRGADLADKFLGRAMPAAPVIKPNLAFLEAAGWSDSMLKSLAASIRAGGSFSICDAKRGDIGNTSRQYANAVFDRWGFDAITVNPLMGRDSVAPFLERPEQGCFLLCVTSNPGADDFLLKNELYLRIAEKAAAWNTNQNVGLVVGATRPEYAARVRELAPNLPLLIPGVGAQGGALNETLDAIQAKSNPNFLINVSRALMYPETIPTESCADWWQSQAETYRDEIRRMVAR